MVELVPAMNTLPTMISFRFKGTRRRYSAPVSWLAQKTIEAEVARLAREKKTRKKMGI